MTLVEYVRSTPFIVCAHRGASGIAPENTLASIQAALDSGAMMVELDVQVTRDNALVVFHDDHLDRTTDGKGLICDRTLDEVKSLDAGSWFDAKFNREHVPTLAEALLLVKGRAYVNIEIKPLIASVESATNIYAIVQTVIDAQMSEYTVFASFDHHALLYIKSIDPHLNTIALNVPNDQRLPHEVVRECLAAGYGCSLEELTIERVEDCIEHHIPIGVYTVNTPTELEYVLELGVQGVVSNYPDVVTKHYLSLRHSS
ncbi:MAG: glycerophosphodiester phosphodiesterase family protein [Candidatus Kapabacteria bacterium]|nr:glycerophosphodiester phosphodiesterase family protein [Candidatus Kapabacteria bacterium]